MRKLRPATVFLAGGALASPVSLHSLAQPLRLQRRCPSLASSAAMKLIPNALSLSCRRTK